MSSALEYPSTPPEVWSLILSSLRPQNLAHVAQVSSSFRYLSLPILYRSVHLRSDSEAVRSTFDLLESAQSLRENIRDLHITGSWRNDGEKPNVCLDLNILASLPGLRVLTLAGLPYDTAKENVTFVAALSSSCYSLKELILLEDPSSDWVLDEDGVEGIVIMSLSTQNNTSHTPLLLALEWPVSHPLYFAEIFIKCRMSLTRLAMVLISGGKSIMSSLPFSMSHFPNLTSLELGPCLDYPDVEGGRVLTQFLIAHPLLEHLSLDFTTEGSITIELCEYTITPDMLPRLRSLHVSVGNIVRLVQGSVRSLQTHLSKLHVKSYQTTAHEAIAMLYTFEEFGGFLVLNEFCYELDIQRNFEEPKFCEKAMQYTGRVCPALERFTVSILLIEEDFITDIFTYFPKITHLCFPLVKGTTEAHDKVVFKLALSCNELVEVLLGLDHESYMKFSLRNGTVISGSIIPGQLEF